MRSSVRAGLVSGPRGPGRCLYRSPYFDELTERALDPAFASSEEAKETPLVAILPGSRTQELIRNLPIMLRAAAKLTAARPDVRFAVACLHERHQELAREIMARGAA